MSDYTQALLANEFDVNNVIFSKKTDHKSKKDGISYSKFNITYKNKNGTVGELVFQFDEVYSFGAQLNKFDNKSWIMSFSMLNSDNPTEYQRQTLDALDKLSKVIAAHVVSLRQYPGKNVDQVLKSFVTYSKADVDLKSPILKSKLMYRASAVEDADPYAVNIDTVFTDMRTGKDYVDFMSQVKDKRCYACPFVKIEGVTMLAKEYHLTVKLYNCPIRLISDKVKRLAAARPIPRDNWGDEEEGDGDGEEDEDLVDGYQRVVEEKKVGVKAVTPPLANSSGEEEEEEEEESVNPPPLLKTALPPPPAVAKRTVGNRVTRK